MIESIEGYKTSFVGLFTEAGTTAEGPAERTALTHIEIPLIQRDYAQGRPNRKVSTIRTTFLEALHVALTGDHSLSLDFVFGDEQDGTLRPLDGQQRLTTLFLIHWYVAVETGRLVAEQPWANLTYATRPSARRFCERLVAVESGPASGQKVSEWIVDRPWYLYVWRHDPTIQSMLVMLDSIQRLFVDDDLERVWERLTDPETPAITFYVLRLPEIGAGDELYIKMNSRGKPLTEFENFKARFGQTISHSSRTDEIALKFDQEWADMLWPFHGGDNIVDDEFIHYLTFIVEICEWKSHQSAEGSLDARATRLFGKQAPDADESLAFLAAAFDAWVGLDIEEFFSELFRVQGSTSSADARPTLFTQGWQGVNLFEQCCRVYGDMRTERERAFPLSLTLLFYGILVHRIEQTDQLGTRVRVLRNVLEASSNEIRADRMHRHIEDVAQYIRTGQLGALGSFNKAQIDDEMRKAAFVQQKPQMRPAVHRLEDHRLLRGALGAFELSDVLPSRAEAFVRVFDDPESWPELTGALLACGDYFRRTSDQTFQFGSPTTDSWWQQVLTGPGRSPLAEVRQPLATLLDSVAGSSVPLTDIYRSVMDAFLDRCSREGRFDWRYYLVRYPEMRAGTSGIFVSETTTMGYTVCALRKRQLNSYYRDPVLLAISEVSSTNLYEVEDPWFSGYASAARWLNINACDMKLRNRSDRLVLQVPRAQRDAVAEMLPDELDIRATEEGFEWWIPQNEWDGELVDSLDRVQVGADMVSRLVRGLGRLHGRASILARADISLRPMITEQLGELCLEGWIHAPEDENAVWVAHQLTDRNCLDLVLRWDDDFRVTPQVKGYRRWAGSVYPGFDHVPLAVGWDASDEEIVAGYMREVDRLRREYPRD